LATGQTTPDPAHPHNPIDPPGAKPMLGDTLAGTYSGAITFTLSAK